MPSCVDVGGVYSMKPATANMMISPRRLSGAKDSEAPDFLLLVFAAPDPVAEGLVGRAPVPVTREDPFTVPVLFASKKMCGELPVDVGDVVLIEIDGRSEIVLDQAADVEDEEEETSVELSASELLEVEGLDDEDEVELGVGVGVGVGLGVGLGVDDAAALLEELEDPESDDPSTLNVTMLAVLPDGTVTTQKSAPPAPVAESELDTTPTPLEGSIEHGSPLQPPPGHSILMPKVGGLFESSHPV